MALGFPPGAPVFPTGIRELHIAKNALTSLAGLEKLTALEGVDAGENQITSTEGGLGHPGWIEISPPKNQVEEITPLEPGSGLQYLTSSSTS